MKKITFLITLLTISLSFGQELIVNGDFEALGTGTIGTSIAVGVWYSSNSVIQDNAANSFGGTKYVNMGNDFRNFRQYFTSEADVEYTVTFWYRNNFAGVADTDSPFVSIRINDGTNGGNGSLADIYSAKMDTYYDANLKDYSEYTFTFQTSETNLVFYIFKDARADGGTNNAVRIDNVSIVPSSTLSTKKLNQFSFKTYPNPATDVLYVSAAKNIDNVEVYNLLGQKAISKSIASKTSQVNVSSLSKGVYILKAFIEGSEETYKFVKQ